MTTNKLQNELKKKRPFDLLEQEAAINLLRTSDLIQNRFLRLFRQFGLTPSQYNVLRILRGEGKPMPCLEIAERMIQVVPAITGLVDRLEKQKLVSRDRSTEDRRVIYIVLTEPGRKILADLDTPVRTLHEELLGHMPHAELKELSRLLEKARQNITCDHD